MGLDYDNISRKAYYMKRNIAIYLAIMLITISCTPNQSEDSSQADTVNPEERLGELGIQLIEPASPTANYVMSVQHEDLIFLAGHGPDKPGGGKVVGKMGKDLTLKEGQQAARITGVSLLSSLKKEIGNLDNVKRIVKVTGMVNATPTFTDHSQVMNGFSDLMVEVFGDRGKHARVAVGMSSLPGNIPVEIDMIVEITD